MARVAPEDPYRRPRRPRAARPRLSRLRPSRRVDPLGGRADRDRRWPSRMPPAPFPASPIPAAPPPAGRSAAWCSPPRTASPAPISPPVSASRPRRSPARAPAWSATTTPRSKIYRSDLVGPPKDRPQGRRARGPPPQPAQGADRPRHRRLRPAHRHEPRRPSLRRDQRRGDRPQDQLPQATSSASSIFAETIQITDDPTRPRGLASRPFDGEGVAGRPLDLDQGRRPRDLVPRFGDRPRARPRHQRPRRPRRRQSVAGLDQSDAPARRADRPTS